MTQHSDTQTGTHGRAALGASSAGVPARPPLTPVVPVPSASAVEEVKQ